jgi:hypothetical protein
MVRWKFVVLIFFGIGALPAGNTARAQQAFTGVDGCAVLGRLVYAEVTADAWYGPGRDERVYFGQIGSGVQICTHTTRTVSEAYASALQAIGAEFRWGYPSGEPGDACLSGFLEQCSPDRYPMGGAHTWPAITRTLLMAMPRGAASDQSVFSPQAMQLALRTALARDKKRR